MDDRNPDILLSVIEFEIFLSILEAMDPERCRKDDVMLALFTVADDRICDLIDQLGRHSLTQRQQAALRHRLIRWKSLGTADIRQSLRRSGCAPAPQRLDH